MNQKTAKKLKRIAKAFVIGTNKPIGDFNKEYKKIKQSYKAAKGQL